MYHFTFALNCSIFNLMININIYLPLCWFLHFPLLYEGEGPRRAKNKIYVQEILIFFAFDIDKVLLEMNWLWKTQNFGKDICRCYWVVKSWRPISHLSGGLLLLLLDLVLPPLLEVALVDDDPAEDDGVLHQGEEHQQHAGQQPHLHTQDSTVQYSTVQYSTVQYSTVRCSTVHQAHLPRATVAALAGVRRVELCAVRVAAGGEERAAGVAAHLRTSG